MKYHFGRKLALAVLAALATTVIPVLNRLILSDAVIFADRGMLAQIALLSILGGLVASVLAGILSFALLQERYDVFSKIMSSLYRRLLSLPPAAMRNADPGDQIQRVATYGVFSCENHYIVRRLIIGVVIALPSFAQMFFYLPQAASAFAVFLALAFAAHALAYLYGSAELSEVQRCNGAFVGLLARFIGGIEKIRAACAEETCFAQLSDIYAKLCAARRRSALCFGYASVFALAPIAFGLLAMYVNVVVLEGAPQAPTAGDCVAFVAAVGIVSGVCPLVFSAFCPICELSRARRRVQPILEAVPESRGGDRSVDLQGDVELQHVTFSYDGRRKVLDDVSIRARPGEVIAIVGPSGAGKSTLIRLLLGFDRPDSGEIHYDGTDMRRFDVRSLRRKMGVVLQNAAASPTSILDNIVGGALDLTVEDAWAAAEAAAVADDIRAFPMGMQTILSPSAVSGGQRQRILIARALVRKPKLLIFDEATSALDNISQRIVNRALISQIGVTEIIVAHRLSTIRAADLIYVLDAGRVVEEGNYDTLMARNGLFAELARRQLTEEGV